MKRLAGWRGRPWRLGALAALVLLLLAAASAGLALRRAQLLQMHGSVARELAQVDAAIRAADALEDPAVVVRYGTLAQTERVLSQQSAVEITYALEKLRTDLGVSRLLTQVGDPVQRRKPVNGYVVVDRPLTLEVGAPTETHLLAFLAGVPSSLNGSVRVERLDIQRGQPVDEDLLLRLQRGERPDVLQATVKVQLSTLQPLAPPAAPAASAPARKKGNAK